MKNLNVNMTINVRKEHRKFSFMSSQKSIFNNPEIAQIDKLCYIK